MKQKKCLSFIRRHINKNKSVIYQNGWDKNRHSCGKKLVDDLPEGGRAQELVGHTLGREETGTSRSTTYRVEGEEKN
jgi:hypothetical protein